MTTVNVCQHLVRPGEDLLSRLNEIVSVACVDKTTDNLSCIAVNVSTISPQSL